MKRRVRRARTSAPGPAGGIADRGEVTGMVHEMATRHETSPALSGGDLDADWQRAHDSGDEAVGGSVATPDQDVVDEIGRALGVAQGSDAEVRASEDILRDRDRFRWHLEREAADEAEGRGRRHRPDPA